MKKMLFVAAVCAAALLATSENARAQCPSCGDGGNGWFNGNGGPTWHGAYANTDYGGPVALAIPHRARTSLEYSWGTKASHITHMRARFNRNAPGCGSGGGGGYIDGFSPTPAWPSHTNQFGVYYVRVPRRY